MTHNLKRGEYFVREEVYITLQLQRIKCRLHMPHPDLQNWIFDPSTLQNHLNWISWRETYISWRFLAAKAIHDSGSARGGLGIVACHADMWGYL